MDYKNGKIYRVVCSETDRQYIGSTASTLVKRLHQHKFKNNKTSCKDFIDPKIFLIEDYPCDRKEQLLMRERFYMESMECVNMTRPIVTKEEELERIKSWRQNNKEKVKINNKKYNDKEHTKQIVKEYREKNKEQIKQKAGEKFVCDCGGKYTHGHKERHIKSNKHQAYLSSIV